MDVKCNDLISAKLTTQYPAMSATAKNWISGISECKWIEEYFCWLNNQLIHLRPKQRKQIIERLVSEHDTKYHESIAEIVYIAFWNYVNWSFDKDPKINGKTPDFRVFYGEDNKYSFLCDVTVVRHNQPHHDLVIDGKRGIMTMDGKPIDELPVATQPINQSHRFLMRIKEKLDKYRQILTIEDKPFVICFFQYKFEDILYLDDFQIRNALFGDLTVNFRTGEFWHQPSIDITQHDQKVNRGIFGFEEYSHVAAVIVCKQEFHPTSNIMLERPKPHYPQKAKFSFAIYSNPLGKWTHRDDNPFSLLGLPVNGLKDVDTLEFCDQKEIEFY